MKCDKCGAKVVLFPIRKQQDKSLGQNFKEKTINWSNLFKMDIQSIMLILLVIFLLFGYRSDIAKCEDAISHPVDFCEKSGCSCYETKQAAVFVADEEDIYKREGGYFYEANQT